MGGTTGSAAPFRFADLRRLHPGDVWECPEVRSPKRIPEPSQMAGAWRAEAVPLLIPEAEQEKAGGPSGLRSAEGLSISSR